MSLIACLTPMPSLVAPARARGMALQSLRAVPDALVRVACWRAGDGDLAARLAKARVGHDAARVLLLVEDAEALAAALDAGADDAALLSASPVEVVARLAALSRDRDTMRWRTIGDLTIDLATQRVWRAGLAIAMLPREYAVLCHLADHAGVAVSRRSLLRQIWGMEFDPGTNVVQVQISRLRARLHAAGPPILHTDRGAGYRLAVPDRADVPPRAR